LTKYRTHNGDLLTATNAADLVQQLHQRSCAPASSDAEFMYQYAARVKCLTGKEIRHDTAEHFVESLLSIGRLFEEI
jgi:hypothetical protein